MQSSTIDENGVASKPVVEAKKRQNKVKSTVSTASEKDARDASIAATTTTDTTPAATEVKTTGSVKVVITIDKD